MAYFRCTSGGSGKGNTVTVTCDSEFAGATITLATTGKSYTKTCPSTSPYTVTFYGIEAGTYTVSATVSGQTYSETVVVQDISAVLNYGFKWETWVDYSADLDSSDYASLAEVLADEEAVRELFTVHACVDYMASMTVADTNVETVLNDDICAKWINNRDYALDTLYANSALADVMDTADKYFYGEWVITDNTTTPPTWGAKGNVPIMTANNAPYGTAFASSANSGYEAYKVFDGTDAVWSSVTGNVGEYVGYTFTSPIKANKAHVRIGYTTASFVIKASNTPSDQNSFVVISDTITNPAVYGAFGDIDVELNTNDFYLAYELVTVSHYSGDRFSYNVKSLQFYGRELSVSVPKMDTNTTPYGEASVSNADTSYPAWKAFDGSDSSYANLVNTANLAAYVQYKFTSPTDIRGVMLLSGSSYAHDCVVAYSDDGITFTDVTDMDFSVGANARAYKYSNTIHNGHIYWRITLTAQTANKHSVYTLQFYGLDYSEKEFEEGTTKKWLYDHGVELVNTDISGYTQDGITSILDAEREASQIYLPPTSSGSIKHLYAVPSSEIDLSEYNLVRISAGNKGTAMNGNYGQVAILPAKAIGTQTASLNITDMKQSNGLGISSVSSGNLIVHGGESTRSYSFKELWLE